MITVKEYANNNSITIQSVYQRLKRKQNKEELKDHICYINGIKYLDDYAIAYLDKIRQNSPNVILQENNKDRMENLERENKALLIKVGELQDQLIKEMDTIKQLQEEKIFLLENKRPLLSKIFKKPHK